MSVATDSNTHQRGAQRVAVWSEIDLVTSPTDVVRGRMRDLSHSGFRVAVPKALAVGATVEVSLPIRSDGRPEYTRAEVMWTEKERNSGELRFVAGLHFCELSTSLADQLRRFIDQRLWSTLDCLGRIPLLSELNDLERLAISGVSLALELERGDSIDAANLDGALVLVQSGRAALHAKDPARGEIRVLTTGAGGFFGSPVNRSSSEATVGCLVVDPRAALVVLPREALDHIASAQPQIFVKLVTAYCRSLEDRLAALT